MRLFYNMLACLLTMFGFGRTACKLLAGAVANLLLAFSGDSLSEKKYRVSDAVVVFPGCYERIPYPELK